MNFHNFEQSYDECRRNKILNHELLSTLSYKITVIFVVIDFVIVVVTVMDFIIINYKKTNFMSKDVNGTNLFKGNKRKYSPDSFMLNSLEDSILL